MYQIEFSDAAKRDLKWFKKYERKIILERIPVPYTNGPHKVALFKEVFECRIVNEFRICSRWH